MVKALLMLDFQLWHQ